MRQLIASVRDFFVDADGRPRPGRMAPAQLAALVLFAAVAVAIGLAILGRGAGSAPSGIAAADALVRADDLRAIAPRSLAGLERVSADVDTSSTLGVRAVVLEAAYRKGDKRLQLTIVQSPRIEDVIGFGGADTDEYDRPEADGYSRRRREGETIIVEQWNAVRKSGSYGRLLPGPFYVFAVGDGLAEHELRDAVHGFSADRLKSLPRES